MTSLFVQGFIAFLIIAAIVTGIYYGVKAFDKPPDTSVVKVNHTFDDLDYNTMTPEERKAAGDAACNTILEKHPNLNLTCTFELSEGSLNIKTILEGEVENIENVKKSLEDTDLMVKIKESVTKTMDDKIPTPETCQHFTGVTTVPEIMASCEDISKVIGMSQCQIDEITKQLDDTCLPDNNCTDETIQPALDIIANNEVTKNWTLPEDGYKFLLLGSACSPTKNDGALRPNIQGQNGPLLVDMLNGLWGGATTLLEGIENVTVGPTNVAGGPTDVILPPEYTNLTDEELVEEITLEEARELIALLLGLDIDTLNSLSHQIIAIKDGEGDATAKVSAINDILPSQWGDTPADLVKITMLIQYDPNSVPEPNPEMPLSVGSIMVGPAFMRMSYHNNENITRDYVINNSL